MSTINLECSLCSKKFPCEIKAFNRAKKRNQTNMFCSRSCSCKHGNSIMPKEKRSVKHLSIINKGNQYAKKGIFTSYLHDARNRKRQEFDLDEEYLQSIWTGKCALSGIDIHLKVKASKLNTASLDRIDSTKGYIKGNIQFVAYGLNLGKNTFSNQEMVELIESIKNC